MAAFPEVRTLILDYQRAFARRPPGAVMDGRDIGTVVCPDADIKFFVTATPQVRAERRYRELRARGENLSYEAVLSLIVQRDERDANRISSPMRQSDDAILLDTTNLDIEAAFEAAVGLIKRKIGQ